MNALQQEEQVARSLACLAVPRSIQSVTSGFLLGTAIRSGDVARHANRFDGEQVSDARLVHITHTGQRPCLKDVVSPIGRNEFILDMDADDTTEDDCVSGIGMPAGQRQRSRELVFEANSRSGDEGLEPGDACLPQGIPWTNHYTWPSWPCLCTPPL